MFAKFLIVPLFIASSVVAVPTFIRRDVSLSDWSSQNLESYWTFKMRYNSLNCTSQTGTDFYNTCCSPLGATQSLSDLPAECTPTTCAAQTNSTPSPTPTPTPTDDVAPVPTTSASDNDDDDDDDTYCDQDGGDDDQDGGDYSSDDSNGQTSPADTPAPTPTDNEDPSPTDNNDPAPTDNNDPAPSQDSSSQDPAPTDNNDPAPSQDSSSQDNSQPAPTDDGSNTGSVNNGGHATYFYQGGNAGACGNYHGDSDLIAAIDIQRYGDTGSVSSLCGQTVHITNTNNGNSVDVVIADVCPTCDNSNSIDLSVGAFQALASLDEGEVPISWYFT